jgi:hypothetical protein
VKEFHASRPNERRYESGVCERAATMPSISYLRLRTITL